MTDLSRNTNEDALTATTVVPESNNKVVPLMGDHWLETASGQRIDFLSPNPNNIDIQDIGWALSRLPRFAGHTVDLVPYTVSVHSCWVATYVWCLTNSALCALHALLHDAHEAYTGDIPAPLKTLPSLREEIHRIEHRLQGAIYTSLNLPRPSDQTYVHIAEADQQALAMEARIHMRSGGAAWGLPEPTHTAVSIVPAKVKNPPAAFEQFMTTYTMLSARLKHLQ